MFIAFPSWWLLAFVLLSAILATCGIIFVLLRTIDGDTRLGGPTPARQRDSESKPAVRAAPSRGVLAGH